MLATHISFVMTSDFQNILWLCHELITINTLGFSSLYAWLSPVSFHSCCFLFVWKYSRFVVDINADRKAGLVNDICLVHILLLRWLCWIKFMQSFKSPLSKGQITAKQLFHFFISDSLLWFQRLEAIQIKYTNMLGALQYNSLDFL